MFRETHRNHLTTNKCLLSTERGTSRCSGQLFFYIYKKTDFHFDRSRSSDGFRSSYLDSSRVWVCTFDFSRKKIISTFFFGGGEGRVGGILKKSQIFHKKIKFLIFVSISVTTFFSRHNFGCLIDFRGSKNDSEHSNPLKFDRIGPNIGIEIIFISLPKRCKWLTVMWFQHGIRSETIGNGAFSASYRANAKYNVCLAIYELIQSQIGEILKNQKWKSRFWSWISGTTRQTPLKGQGQSLPYPIFFCQFLLGNPGFSRITFPLEFGAENLTAAQKYIELTNSTKKRTHLPSTPLWTNLGEGVLISRLRFWSNLLNLTENQAQSVSQGGVFVGNWCAKTPP